MKTALASHLKAWHALIYTEIEIEIHKEYQSMDDRVLTKVDELGGYLKIVVNQDASYAEFYEMPKIPPIYIPLIKLDSTKINFYIGMIIKVTGKPPTVTEWKAAEGARLTDESNTQF